MLEIEDSLLIDPQQVRAARELRQCVRYLAHVGRWPEHLDYALLTFLFAIVNDALSRLPVPETVGPPVAALFLLALLLGSLLVARLLRRIQQWWRRAFGLERWPKPRYDFSLLHFVGIAGLLVATILVHERLGLGQRFDLVILVVGGVTRFAMAYQTRVKRYAVEGAMLLSLWAVGVGLLGAPPQAPTLFGIVLTELLTAAYGWREWLHVRDRERCFEKI